MNKIKIFKIYPDAKTPTRNKRTDAGLDLYANEGVFIPVGRTVRIQTGIAIEIPEGYVGRVCDRSGMALKGFSVGAGVIDTGYNGDCSVVLHNLNNKKDTQTFVEGCEITKGDKIAQIMVFKVETPEVEVVEELWTSERGSNGFGSSGK